MRFIHLSDLHIGKRLNGVSLIEDQKYILSELIRISRDSGVDAVVIAGDVYDKSAPSAEAVALLDDFLTGLSELDIPVLIISGNHDSPERLSFGGRLMKNIHIYSVFDGSLKCIRIHDVDFYMLPFVRPQQVRRFFDCPELCDYNEMANLIFRDFHKHGKSVIVMHQFITAGTRQDTVNAINVGTLDNINASYISDFDYAALGHVHTQQRIGSGNIIYCGSPLKYSFAEADTDKHVIIVDTDNNMSIEKIPLKPLRDMRKIRGSLDELLSPETYTGTNTSDFLHVTLTDEDEITDAQAKLRNVYENVLEIEFEHDRNITGTSEIDAEYIRTKTPAELFENFFEDQNGRPMNERQKKIINDIMEEICVR